MNTMNTHFDHHFRNTILENEGNYILHHSLSSGQVAGVKTFISKYHSLLSCHCVQPLFWLAQVRTKIFVAKWVWQDRGPILTASVGKDGFADLCIEMVIWQGIERGLFTNTICNLQALF